MRLWIDLVNAWPHQQNLPGNNLALGTLKSEACTKCYVAIPVAIFQLTSAEEKINMCKSLW